MRPGWVAADGAQVLASGERHGRGHNEQVLAVVPIVLSSAGEAAYRRQRRRAGPA